MSESTIGGGNLVVRRILLCAGAGLNLIADDGLQLNACSSSFDISLFWCRCASTSFGKLLAAHRTERSLLFVGTEPQFNFTFHDCEVWAIYQAAAALAIVAAVDYVLILRGILLKLVRK
jgi:hypothetical protein